MKRATRPEKSVYLVWLSVAMTFCWPLPADTARRRIVGMKVLLIISIINGCAVILAMLYWVHLHLNDVISLFKCICVALCLLQYVVQAAVCLVKYDTLQRVVDEMMGCIKEGRMREILREYASKRNTLYGASIVSIYVCGTSFIFAPLFLPNPFPFETEYPFRVNTTTRSFIIYASHVLVIFQSTAHMCLCAFGALLLWFTAARFECLTGELRAVTSVDVLVVCLEKHSRLKRYAEEVVSCIRFLVFHAILLGTFVLTLCGIVLIINSPLIVKAQFIIICVCILLEIYLYALPADYMYDMSINISRSVYDSIWYEQRLDLQKALLTVLAFQKPIAVSINVLLPELTIRYYCSYVSNALSIFAALRTLVDDS